MVRVTPAELREAALRYAELGYAVFPCVPKGKKPLTKNGFLNASTDAAEIEEWWAKHPGANVGIAAAGLAVIDIDGADNPWPGDPDRAADLAGAGAIATTPRGGRHHVYRRPEGKAWRNSQSRVAKGIDVRTDGGYIVAAPSVTLGKSYAWLPGLELDEPPAALPEPPAWLAAELDRVAEPPPISPTAANGASSGAPANTIPVGQRNGTLARLAGSMRRVGMSQVEIAAAIHRVNEDRCRPPIPAKEVDQIAASISRYDPDQIATAVAENHFAQMRGPTGGGGPPDPGPFPEPLLAVPGFIGEVMAYTQATAFRLQPVLALAGALTLLGTLTGRKVRDEVDTRTNVYCIGVCPTGGGKERARLVNKEILFLAGAARLAGPEGLASHAGLITAIEQQPAILFQLDEVGRLLRTLADPGRSPHLYHIATNLMKLFTSSASVYIGDAYADAKRNKVIHQPHACLWGTTVPQSLYEGFTAENVTDGFLSRVMIFECEEELPPKRKPAGLLRRDRRRLRRGTDRFFPRRPGAGEPDEGAGGRAESAGPAPRSRRDSDRGARPGDSGERLDRLVWELAGILGIDPGPFTLRELLIMGEADSRQRWAHTSAVLALLANAHRDPKKGRPFQPADFNPHLRQKEPVVAKVGIAALKQVFVDRPKPGA